MDRRVPTLDCCLSLAGDLFYLYFYKFATTVDMGMSIPKLVVRQVVELVPRSKAAPLFLFFGHAGPLEPEGN